MGSLDINEALQMFECYEYDACVQMLIRCYEADMDREWIKDFFYQNFINPNDEEFRANYSENAGNNVKVKYEDCTIDLIPVSDDKYYLYSKAEGVFFGSIDLNERYNVLAKSHEPEFRSLLIADAWDIRLMQPNMNYKNYRRVYIVLDNNKASFASFLKIKGIKERFLDNALVFFDVEEMKVFFKEHPSVYLPRDICAAHDEKYIEIINELRRERIEDVGRPRDNIFLSVCIPSYNRGHRAVESIRWMQNLVYDVEVEFVVSDNGSVENTEGYEEIERIQKKDSRVKYFRFEKNQGALANFLKVAELASGHFIAYLSDEDYLALRNIDDFFNLMYSRISCSVGYFSQTGESNGVKLDDEYYTDLPDRIGVALNANYLTGTVINNRYIKENGLIDIIRANTDNKYVGAYPHCALAALATPYGDSFFSSMIICDEGKPEPGRETCPQGFTFPERIRQGTDCIEFLMKWVGLSGLELVFTVRERIYKTFSLVNTAFVVYEAEYDRHEWRRACEGIFSGWCDYIKTLPVTDDLKEETINYNAYLRDLFIEHRYSDS